MADEGYSPRGYLDDDVRDDADKAGRAAKHQTFGLRLKLADGHVSLLYGLLTGLPWMNLEETRIEIPFHGLLRLGGKWRRYDGDWAAVITGRNLEVIFEHINDGRQASLHRSGGALAREAHVEAIVIEEIPPEGD